MSKKEEHTDPEVYFLGGHEEKPPRPSRKWLIAAAAFLLLLIVTACLLLSEGSKADHTDYYFEPEGESMSVVTPPDTGVPDTTVARRSYVERLEETVNDVPMYIYVPYNACLSLGLSARLISDDSAVICAMQAADIRNDNKQIVGDFVIGGKRLSRGVAKKGYCAVVGDQVTIGMGEETPLLQQAIAASGYFFRQYPLVCRSELIENTLKNKSIRRAIGIRAGKVIMIESRSNESLHDFAQALIDIGVTDAITLVGSATAYGWYREENGMRTTYGNLPDEKQENISYIVWKEQ